MEKEEKDKSKQKITAILKEFATQLFKVIALVYKSNPAYTITLGFVRILDGISPAIQVYIGKLVIDNVVFAINSGPTAENIQRVLFLVGLEFAVTIYSNFLANLAMHLDSVLKDIFQRYAMIRLLRKATELDVSYFDNPEMYDKLEKVQREVGYRPMQVLYMISDLFASFFGFLSLMAILLRLHPAIVPFLVVFSFPRLLFRLKYSYYTYGLTDRRVKESRKVNYASWLLTNNKAAAEVRVFDLANHFINRIKEISDKFIGENTKLSAKQSSGSFLLDTLSSIAYYGTYLYIVNLAMAQKITLGDLAMYSQAFQRATLNLQGVSSIVAHLYENHLFLKNFFEFETFTPKIHLPKSPVFLEDRPLRIEFRNISFRYSKNKPYVLNNVNLTIEPTQNVAIVGENGAGKTTLIKLLLHLYEPESGEILINGTNIKDIDQNLLRKNVSAIFQEYQTYLGTVEENIGFGNLDQIGDSEKIRVAAELSGADEIAKKYPKGYKTLLGHWFEEEGEELSGGQWQKIALARAFFSDAKVLVMDEPTASLDPKAEYEVFEKLLEKTRNKTLVLISHRFSTVRQADKIFVLENGQITESGNHDELMTKNGTYANLFNLQAKWYK